MAFSRRHLHSSPIVDFLDAEQMEQPTHQDTPSSVRTLNSSLSSLDLNYLNDHQPPRQHVPSRSRSRIRTSSPPVHARDQHSERQLIRRAVTPRFDSLRTTAAEETISSNGIQARFSRSTPALVESNYPTSAEEDYYDDEDDEDDEGPIYIPPSASARPLQNRPQPREDRFQGLFPPGGAAQDITRLEEQRERNPATTMVRDAHRRALEVTSISGPITRSLVTRSIDSDESLMAPAHFYAKELRDREQLAIQVALEPKYVNEWGFFLKCYAEGRFNVSRPPQPPPRKITFQFLPALSPSDEIERLKAVKRIGAMGPHWDAEKSTELVRDAALELGTRFAALSLFDRKHEIVRAGSGYDAGVIPRGESIGAHLLLGSGPMVILDTREDWRFDGHPLVRSRPYIRFYAAAPLATRDGHPVGALAVFDTQPRAGFSLGARSALVRLAARAGDLLREAVVAARSAAVENGEAGNQSSVTTVVQYTGGRGEQRHALSLNAKLTPNLDTSSRVASSERSVSPTHVSGQGHQSLVGPRINSPTETVVQRSGPDDDYVIEEETSSQSTGSTIRQRTPERPAPQVPEGPRPLSLTPRQRRREAHYLMSLTAQNLGWDFVYLVRVLPGFPRPSRWTEHSPVVPSTPTSSRVPSTPTTPSRKQHRDSFEPQFVQLILAHGYHNGYEPPHFSVDLHLRALRSASGLMFRNQGQWASDGSHVGYEYGLIIPLTRDGHSYATPTSSSRSSPAVGNRTPTSPSSSRSRPDSKRSMKEGKEEKESQQPCYDNAWFCESGYVLGAFQKKMPPPLLFESGVGLELEDPFDETVMRTQRSSGGGGIGGGGCIIGRDSHGIILSDDDNLTLDVGIGLAISHDAGKRTSHNNQEVLSKNKRPSQDVGIGKGLGKGKGKARAEKVMTMIIEEDDVEFEGGGAQPRYGSVADEVEHELERGYEGEQEHGRGQGQGQGHEEGEGGIIWGPTDEDIHSLTDAGKRIMEILFGE
ncbi:MAG: hypothetical protein M1823_002680 [Watsoniomyces obsoletus]|nr:MAG: hypothetical protein M1823_002680 [Watsoniomyces obsoletus]